MKLSGDARVYLFILAISLFTIVWSLFGANYRFESKLLPVLIGSIVLVLAVAGLWNEFRARRTPEAAISTGRALDRENWRGYLIHFGWVVGFLFAIYCIGYLLAMPIFLFSYTRRLGSRFPVAIASALTVPAFIYVAFELALEVKLYRGLLFSWLS